MSEVQAPCFRSLPPGWEIASIGQLAVHVGSGVTPVGGSEVYTDSGVIFIRSQNVTSSGLSLDDVAFIDQKTHLRMRASEISPCDVLLNITGASIGRCCIVPVGFDPANVNQHVCAIRLPTPDLNDAKFLCSVLASPIGQSQIFRLNAGANREGLNYQQLRSFRVPWPPQQSRRAIAEVFSMLDETIEQTEELVAKYQQIKAGLMHDLFTRGVTPDGRLRPTRAEAPHLYKESSVGWIPQEWRIERLGAILKKCGGYLQTGPFGSQLHAHEYQHEGIPVVMPQDITEGFVSSEQIARISEERGDQLSRHRMKTGDVVIARRGDLSRASAITDREQTWLCGTGCFLLRLAGSSLRADFAALAYRHDIIQRQIAGIAVGTTMSSLNNAVMERLWFPFCDPGEQVRITERVVSVDGDIRSVRAHLEKSRQIKLGLMHDLLTGRVRVPLAETAS